LSDGLEIVGALELAGEAGSVALGSLIAWAILGPILTIVAGLLELAEANAVSEKLAGARGFAYGVTWGVLGKERPSATCHGNTFGAEQDQKDQQEWDKGADQGFLGSSDAVLKNRCIIWMAQNKDDGSELVKHVFTESASHLGVSSSHISTIASLLEVDTPRCN
jgi:hypothetical protein